MSSYSHFTAKSSWIFERVGVREIGLRSFADCTGHVFGIGDVNDCFHDSGNKPASNEWLSKVIRDRSKKMV